MGMEGSKSLNRSLKPIRAEFRWGTKKSGTSSVSSQMEADRTKKIFVKAINSEKTGQNKSKIQQKLQKIRRKLRSGARLTGEEKEFLRKYAPELYRQVVAIERERAAYEEQLETAKTREEAERIQTSKMAGSSGMMGKNSSEFQQIRAAQIQAANQALQIKISAKPWKKELENKKKRMKKTADEQAHRERRMKRLRRWEDGRMQQEISDERISDETMQDWEKELLHRRSFSQEMMEEQTEEQKQEAWHEVQRAEAILTEKRAIVYGDGASTAGNAELDKRPLGFVKGKAAYSAVALAEEERQEKEKDGKYIRKA